MGTLRKIQRRSRQIQPHDQSDHQARRLEGVSHTVDGVADVGGFAIGSELDAYLLLILLVVLLLKRSAVGRVIRRSKKSTKLGQVRGDFVDFECGN